MKNSRTTAGATLVLTVLVVMLLLSAVVVVTAQLAISARRSSADQQATVQAQYIAESGVARAQARLNLINNLMTTSLKPAANTTTPQMLTWMWNLCGVAPTPAQLSAPVAGIGFATPATLCSVATGATDLLSGVADLANSSRLNLFTYPGVNGEAGNIPDAAYAANGYSLSGDTATAEKAFWAESLRPSGVAISGKVGVSAIDNVQGSVGLALKKVERFGLDSYRLTFTLPDVISTSATDGAGRQVKVAGVSNEYTYEIGRGSFAQYALFTNNHVTDAAADAACASNPATCSRVTFTSNTLFSGPVHTNQSFLMQGSPYFSGLVESAGCPGGAANDAFGNPGTACSSAPLPGAYVNGKGFVSAGGIVGNTPVFCAVATVPCPTASTLASPQFQGGINWSAPFQPLPTNSNDQATAAATGGLYLAGSVSDLNMAVGSITPSGTLTAKPVQLINYTQTLAGLSISTQMAVSEDKQVYINTGTGAVPIWRLARQLSTGLWVDALLPVPTVPTGVAVTATAFNGVIYTPGGIGSLKGPARTTASDPATAPPALASFSQITVAAAGDIHIKGDLTYQSPPCTGSNSVTGGTFTAAPCANLSATNILGVYSSAGDVAIDSPSKYPGNGVGPNVTIQAVLMASKKSVRVDGYNEGTADGSLGQVKLLGGIIENYYGAFGITDGRGFGRNYVYDPRTGDGLAPPSFPTQQSWATDFKKTTDPSGASIKTPLKLEGSQTTQKIQ
jgi:Tfp pilus assembly protein PilX